MKCEESKNLGLSGIFMACDLKICLREVNVWILCESLVQSAAASLHLQPSCQPQENRTSPLSLCPDSRLNIVNIKVQILFMDNRFHPPTEYLVNCKL